MKMQYQVVVIGAGAGGMMAAGKAAEEGAAVLLLEKTGRVGQKLLITGNGRCNITNAAPLQRFIDMYGANGPFLHGAFDRFFRDDLIGFFSRYGLGTVEEADGRIFPASGKASDVVAALKHYLSKTGAVWQLNSPVNNIRVTGGRVKGVESGGTFIPADAVILAAGGSSYSKTGSGGDGYKLASGTGHNIVPLRPALVPLAVKEKNLVAGMQGASIEARVTAFACKSAEIEPARIPSFDCGRGLTGKRPRHPVIASRTGDIMFTQYGISGPCILKMSLAVVDALESGPVSILIDLKPHSPANDLRRELIEGLSRHSKKTFINFVREITSPKLADTILHLAGAMPQKLCHQVNSAEREKLLGILKGLRFNIASPLSMDAAMVTAGGISLKEINPHTMGSLLVQGLYFCGEVIDIDAETGGFNLQAAFSTGYLAGEAAATWCNQL